MSHSIRFKLFVIFFIILALLQGFFVVFSANVLETVMIYGNKMEMKQMVAQFQMQLSQNHLSTSEEKELLLAQLSYEWDGNLTLIDSQENEVKTTVPVHGMRGGMMERGQLTKEISRQFEELGHGHVKSFVKKDRNGNDSLVIFVARVNDTQILFSEKPLNVLRESSKLVSRFLTFSGAVTVLIGSLSIFILSKRLTQPIIEIEEQANRIAKLDFEQPNSVVQNDEIGSLGTAVNLIATALSDNIGALNRANEQLKDEIENERRLERMRRQFVTNVSHELKTPMSMIIGYADGLKYGIAKEPNQVDHYCDVILSESDKMNTLINDLLDMSAYQEGQLPMQQSSFNFSSTIEKTMALYIEQANLQGIQLHTKIESDISLTGDQFRVEQVLRNLLSNAFKHVSENGIIEVGMRKVENEALLWVYNEGESIPKDEVDAIWMSFYRGSIARDKQIDGFGIGLALVKEIVNKHNGSVCVRNLENGVSFEVRLPMGEA